MNNERSRPPVKQTGRRQEQEAAPIWSGRTPAGYFESILPHGAENAVGTTDLLNLTKIRTARRLRLAVADARKAGAVILSNADGYFLPDVGEKGRQEAAAFVAVITAKGASTLRAADSARAWLNTLPGQVEIGGGD